MPDEIHNARMVPTNAAQFEPFVEAADVASFLSVPRAEVLKLTRERKIRGYPYRGRQRHRYRYRLSEVMQDFVALSRKPSDTIRPAAPVSQRRHHSDG